MQDGERAEELLAFWFGPSVHDPDEAGARTELWFGGGDVFDRTLGERFGEDAGRAARGELDAWAEEPRPALALVLLLDQLPRNLHRGSARAFAQDARAQAVCVDGIRAYRDRALAPVERVFFYMPLMHAEDRKLQQRALGKFERLLQDAPRAWTPFLESCRDYAAEHRDVVERFGRFPHRNRALGRATTAEERAFLESGGSSWGQ